MPQPNGRTVGINPGGFHETLVGNLYVVHEPVALSKKDAGSIAVSIERQKVPAIVDRAEQLRSTQPHRHPQKPTLRMLGMLGDQSIDHAIGRLPVRIGHRILDLLSELDLPIGTRPKEDLLACPIGLKP